MISVGRPEVWPMYSAFGLLRSDTDFTPEEVAVRLAARLPGFSIAREGDRVVVSRGEWWIAVALVSGEHVRLETLRLVEHLAGVEPAEAEALVASARRVEVGTDVTDPPMEHFNDYLSVVEVLKSFRGLLAVDPKEPSIL
jgi:hypothetical protein